MRCKLTPQLTSKLPNLSSHVATGRSAPLQRRPRAQNDLFFSRDASPTRSVWIPLHTLLLRCRIVSRCSPQRTTMVGRERPRLAPMSAPTTADGGASASHQQPPTPAAAQRCSSPQLHITKYERVRPRSGQRSCASVSATLHACAETAQQPSGGSAAHRRRTDLPSFVGPLQRTDSTHNR